MVTSAKRPYFYFRSKIWRHHRPRSGRSRGSNAIKYVVDDYFIFQ